MPMSWVTKTTVWPSALSFLRMASTSAPLRESKAPVGSSAKITDPPFIKARQIDALCCWPPESCPGLLSALSPKPKASSNSRARSLRSAGAMPAYTAGTSTLRKALISPIK